LGKKLLITSKGRCNITRAEEDPQIFINDFGKNGKFLYPALNALSIEDTIQFFNSKGLKTKVERGKRVFPVSDNSHDVWQVLLDFLKKNKVQIVCNSPVKSLAKKNSLIEKIITTKDEIVADKYIIATGGLSYPETGSSGDGFKWAKDLGHTIVEPKPTLVPIKCKETWIKAVEGLSLRNVRITAYQNGRKQDERFGEALFTGDGMSGPIILDLSKKIGQLLSKGEVELRIDLKQALEFPQLDERIQRDFKKRSNGMFKNSLDDLLPQSLIPVFIRLSGIPPQKIVNSITKEERKILLHLFKELTVHAVAIAGFEKAVITSGGVSLKEIDPKTMRSKLIDNLYFAGEILDLDGPTGGYNLQVAWSTGHLAGENAAKE